VTGSAEGFWTRRHGDPEAERHDNFLSHPLVAAYVSIRAFGAVTAHIDAFGVAVRERTRPGSRVLSVGCGPAGKERVLARMMPDRRFEGMDVAGEVVEEARAEIAKEGLENLELWRGDFNSLDLEAGRYDAILGMGAFHHVEALERFWEECRKGLAPGGWILAQEYVGPPRFQWTEAQQELGTRALEAVVPDRLKPHHRGVTRLPVEAITDGDPSEAVRSDEILPTLRAAGFEVTAVVGAGGSLLQPVLMHQIGAYEPKSWEDNHVLASLFLLEDRAIRSGALGDDFAMFVARAGGRAS
jgi:SAM-dependent methyltransferase